MLNLARALKADIYTGFIDKKKTFDTRGIKIYSLNASGPQIYRNIRIAKKFENFKFPKQYDAYIFSGVWCISAAKNCHPNILYLHTPIRALYDLKDYFVKKANPTARIILKKFIKYWTPKDKLYMSRFDCICANSQNVKNRVLKYYGRRLYKRTVVVYTGIEMEKYKYIRDGSFYLSAARLDALKRIDMIIRAFKMMQNRKLIIAGSGPEEKKLKELAKDCKNIKFLGSVSDQKLLHLYGTCKATIAANVDEDLGLIAIESHASGKPIAAVKEGGFLETVNSKNGVFFTDEKDLIRAVKKLERIKWDHKSIRQSAKKFDISMFSKNIMKLVRTRNKHA